MLEPHPAEPALTSAHDGLSLALVLLGDYNYLDPQVTPDDLAELTIRIQMIATRLTSVVDMLAKLNRRTVHDDATGAGPAIANLVAVETAKGFLEAAHDRLRTVPDALGSARKHLRLASQPVPPNSQRGSGDA